MITAVWAGAGMLVLVGAVAAPGGAASDEAGAVGAAASDEAGAVGAAALGDSALPQAANANIMKISASAR
jgi:hypothetical protein